MNIFARLRTTNGYITLPTCTMKDNPKYQSSERTFWGLVWPRRILPYQDLFCLSYFSFFFWVRVRPAVRRKYLAFIQEAGTSCSYVWYTHKMMKTTIAWSFMTYPVPWCNFTTKQNIPHSKEKWGELLYVSGCLDMNVYIYNTQRLEFALWHAWDGYCYHQVVWTQ